MVKNQQIFEVIEKIAPRYLAEKWDNVGLQIGAYHQNTERILLTLDVTEDVIYEAIEKNINLIISHHPFIFNGIKSICVDSGKGRLVSDLIKNNISVYSAHTNLDSAKLGLNHYIAGQIGLIESKPLDPSPYDRLFKLVIYSPASHTDIILKVLGDNGAGYVGKYSHCSFRSVGKGTFKPLEGSHPYLGETEKISTVPEDRIETIIDDHMAQYLIKKIKNVHPYEEMAYDLFPMDESLTKNANGLGKIGTLEKPMDPKRFIEKIKRALDLKSVRTAGKAPKIIKNVALCTGSGSEFIGLAKIKNADVLVTGDLKYHEAQRAMENHLWVIDAGHFGTEKMVVYQLKDILDSAFPDMTIKISENIRDFIEVH